MILLNVDVNWSNVIFHKKVLDILGLCNLRSLFIMNMLKAWETELNSNLVLTDLFRYNLEEKRINFRDGGGGKTFTLISTYI